MNNDDFVTWLNGCFDMMENKTFNVKQTEMIREKLKSIRYDKELNFNMPISTADYKYPTPALTVITCNPYKDLPPSASISYPGSTNSYTKNVEHQGQSIAMSYSTSYPYQPRDEKRIC